MWFLSVQFSHSVVSDSLRPHESQHARPSCPSPTPGVHWDSRPSSQWCIPAISSSVIPFSSCPQSLPASESFPMSQLFAWYLSLILTHKKSKFWTLRKDCYGRPVSNVFTLLHSFNQCSHSFNPLTKRLSYHVPGPILGIHDDMMVKK